MRTALLIIGMLASIPASAGAADVGGRPNLLLLVTDDQRWDCWGGGGHPHLLTPHIDELARAGVTFTHSFVTTSICCVSRASLMTGRLARNHRVPDFGTPLPPDVLESSFPVLLQKAGYRVGCVGKWGIGGPPPKDRFDFWDAWGDQGHFFHIMDGERIHNSEYLARRSAEFIASTPSNQPFCLIVLYKSPHEPYQPDSRDANLFEDVTIDPPKTAELEHFERLPDFPRTTLGRAWALRDLPTPKKYQNFVKQYLRCMASVDRSVGDAINAGENAAAGNYTAAFLSGIRPSRDAIATDDEVLSRDENDPDGPLVWQRVEEVFSRWAFVAEVEAGGRVIGTTLEHPFRVAGKGWVDACELAAGDRIAGLVAGEGAAVGGVRETGRYERVYNLRVAETHTYFVGDEEWGFGLWAHNACSPAQLKANNAAGKVAEAAAKSWLVSKGLRIVGEQVIVHTSRGRRVIDFVVERGGQRFAVEVKSGNARLKLSQHLKDLEIAGGNAWHFVDGVKKQFRPDTTIQMYF